MNKSRASDIGTNIVIPRNTGRSGKFACLLLRTGNRDEHHKTCRVADPEAYITYITISDRERWWWPLHVSCMQICCDNYSGVRWSQLLGVVLR